MFNLLYLRCYLQQNSIYTIRGNSAEFNDSILHSFPRDSDFVLLQPALFAEVILMFWKYLCWILRNYV